MFPPSSLNIKYTFDQICFRLVPVHVRKQFVCESFNNQIVVIGKWHGGHSVNRDVRYGPHNLTYA